METNQSHKGWTLLLYEQDGLVTDRLRQMAQAEGFQTCAVDNIDLFHALRAQFSFDLFAVGVRNPRDLDGLQSIMKIEPLVLLAPLRGKGGVTHYRVAIPGASILDRDLRDPDALRRVVRADGADTSSVGTPDPVRSAFELFGLSERQLDVLSCALMGESGSDIAQKLFISELTVRNHLHAIYERVGVSGRRELLGRFVQGLIEGHA
ncbi:MAG: helix-turn-helix transcriptional regulator [bacterium]|nr:helix-turn-helix transcriptional regulator [bacterium]